MSNSHSQPETPRRPKAPDGISPVARAAQWTSRIMTISLEMVLPGLAGYWLDQKLGTKALFMLIGFVLGGIAAFAHLIHVTRSSESSSHNVVSNKSSHFKSRKEEENEL